MRQPLKSSIGGVKRAEQANSFSAPAPVGGLNTRDAEAVMRSIYATMMINFWPQDGFVGIRGGATRHVLSVPSAVKQLGAWNGASSKKLLAFTDTGAYDVTAASTTPVTTVAFALTSGDVVHTNFTTSGQNYIVGVNGTDNFFTYNGTAWTNPATLTVTNGISGETIATNKFSYVAAHQRALFFIEKNSMNMYYMPPDQISTSVSRFPLGGLFRKGSKLAAIGSWTVNGGEGKQDFAVFLTQEGQAAIYEGTDPNTAATWGLRGVFDVGRPLGITPVYKLGGDLLIITNFGLMSLTQVMKRGYTSTNSTLTNIISRKFQEYALGNEASKEWRVYAEPGKNLLLVNVPGASGRPRSQLAMNLITGAWTEFNGWDTTCWETLNGEIYAGVGNSIGKMWNGSGDFGARIACYVKCAWLYLSPRSRVKTLSLIRFLIRLNGQIQLGAAVDVDFRDGVEYNSVSRSDQTLSRYDSATYNVSTWSSLPSMQLDWLTLPCKEGYCLAPRLRAYAGEVTFEWSAIDYTYNTGGPL